MSAVIRKCSIAEAEAMPNLPEILEEYAKELVVEGAPPWQAKMELYYQLEAAGILQGFAAFVNDVMVGFVTVLITVLPHNGVIMAVTESYFVVKKFRGTQAGFKLLGEAEQYAKERGSPCLLVSAPVDGDLAKVLPRVGYTHTNSVFFRSLKDV
jgi:GNAT superfamily N-acetyltransferase